MCSVPLNGCIILNVKYIKGLEGSDYEGTFLNSPERNEGNSAGLPAKLPTFDRVSYKHNLNVTLHQRAVSKCRVGGD